MKTLNEKYTGTISFLELQQEITELLKEKKEFELTIDGKSVVFFKETPYIDTDVLLHFREK